MKEFWIHALESNCETNGGNWYWKRWMKFFSSRNVVQVIIVEKDESKVESLLQL